MPDIKIVEDKLKQVMLNILQNSEESITHDNGKIVVFTESVNLEVKISLKIFLMP